MDNSNIRERNIVKQFITNKVEFRNQRVQDISKAQNQNLPEIAIERQEKQEIKQLPSTKEQVSRSRILTSPDIRTTGNRNSRKRYSFCDYQEQQLITRKNTAGSNGRRAFSQQNEIQFHQATNFSTQNDEINFSNLNSELSRQKSRQSYRSKLFSPQSVHFQPKSESSEPKEYQMERSQYMNWQESLGKGTLISSKVHLFYSNRKNLQQQKYIQSVSVEMEKNKQRSLSSEYSKENNEIYKIWHLNKAKMQICRQQHIQVSPKVYKSIGIIGDIQLPPYVTNKLNQLHPSQGEKNTKQSSRRSYSKTRMNDLLRIKSKEKDMMDQLKQLNSCQLINHLSPIERNNETKSRLNNNNNINSEKDKSQFFLMQRIHSIPRTYMQHSFY